MKSEEQLELEEKQSEEARKNSHENDTEYNKTLIKKIAHFWTYEKWKVIVAVICIVVVVSLVRTYIEEKRELALDIAMVNTIIGSTDDVTFEQEFARWQQIDLDALPIRMEVGLMHPKDLNENAQVGQDVIASIQKYQNLLATGRMDVTISTDWMINAYEENDAYCNLKEVLPQDLFDLVKDRLYYSENHAGEKIPIGIYVQKKEVLNYYEEQPIVVISKYSTRIPMAVQFIKWLEE